MYIKVKIKRAFSPTLCQRCGRATHSINQCFAKTGVDGRVLCDSEDEESSKELQFQGCQRCGRTSHVVSQCFANTGVDGRVLNDSEDESEEEVNTSGVYVLLLTGQRIYVGTSSNIAVRIEQHCSGTGAAWTRTYPPLRRLPPISKGDEREETLEQMLEHGIDNVRGYRWTRMKTDKEERRTILIDLIEHLGFCRRCGYSGHFITHCRVSGNVSVTQLEKNMVKSLEQG